MAKWIETSKHSFRRKWLEVIPFMVQLLPSLQMATHTLIRACFWILMVWFLSFENFEKPTASFQLAYQSTETWYILTSADHNIGSFFFWTLELYHLLSQYKSTKSTPTAQSAPESPNSVLPHLPLIPNHDTSTNISSSCWCIRGPWYPQSSRNILPNRLRKNRLDLKPE